jgi:choline dehydrogenase
VATTDSEHPGVRRTIVVGAGSSGGIIAARLSEDASEHVILIEAGPDFATTDDLPEALRDASNPQLVGYDWELESFFIEPAEDRPPVPYPRGKLVGGSSAVNAAIAQRGTIGDFEAWAARGNDEWSWTKVRPYFERVESDQEFGEEEFHGGDGPIPITRSLRQEWSPAVQAMDIAFRNRGYESCADHNAPESTGFGPTPRNKIGIYRASTSMTYLREARDRPNLEIVPDTEVVRVLFEGTRAVGVEVDRGAKLERIEADRVVLSGGAVKTPQILTLSGVGPKEVLGKLGIQQVVNLPGVGQNLQDHPFVPLLYTAAGHEDPRYGFMTELKYSYSDGDGPENDLMVFPAVIETASMNFDVKEGVSAALMANALLAKPRSTGWLEVKTTDHTVQPEMHMNFLGEDVDVTRLAHAVRLVIEVLTSEPVAAEVDEPLLMPDPEVVEDDERLRDWMREMISTGYHCTGTCRMGPADDENAVLTQKLEVRGTENLFVGDASIMPEITTGLTNLTCYMIGEKLADWLRDAED